MHCLEDTSELLVEISRLVHFNAAWHNSQLELQIFQLAKIANDSGEAFTGPMRELLNKYADVLTKPGKSIISFHAKVGEFPSLGINPKIYPKEPAVNINPNNQSQSAVVPRDTVAPCPYIYRHSGVQTV